MPKLKGNLHPVYQDPLRSVQNLTPERIDQGVDYSGTGDVYALGPGVIDQVYSNPGGWPNNVYIEEDLTGGPDRGKRVYMAEDVTPKVSVGQHVNSNTVIGHMFQGGDGIETGWASRTPNESLAHAEGQYSFPTKEGLSYNRTLVSVGAPSGLVDGKPATKSHYKGPTGNPGSNATTDASQKCPSFWGALAGTIFTEGGASAGLSEWAQCRTGSSAFGKEWSNILGFLDNPVDTLERLGLIVFGSVLVIVGLIIIGRANGGGNGSGMKTALKGAAAITGGAETAEVVGAVNAGGRPRRELTPEERQDRERRLALAEQNANTGAQKVQTAQMKEMRLSGRASYPNKRPGNRRAKPGEHSGTGGREPNPEPVHA